MGDTPALFDARPWKMHEQLVTGTRYEFEDFAGARFTGTLEAWGVSDDGQDGRILTLRFEDRPPFRTNLPIRWREAE